MPQTAATATPSGPATRRKQSAQQRGTPFYYIRLLVVLIVLTALMVVAVEMRPRMELLGQSPFATKLHVLSAVGSFLLGGVVLAWRKGTTLHRIGGWFWVFMMTASIVSSVFVKNPDTGGLGWIHLSSLFHGVCLLFAVIFALRRNIKWHSRLMVFTYISGMIGGLLTAFIPGRLMFDVFF